MSGITGGGRDSAQITANLDDDILAPLELQAWIYGGMNPERRRQMHLALALDRLALCEEVETYQEEKQDPELILAHIHQRLGLQSPPEHSPFRAAAGIVVRLMKNPAAVFDCVIRGAVMRLGGLSAAVRSYAAAAPLPDLRSIPDRLDADGQLLDAMLGLATYTGGEGIEASNAAAHRVVTGRGRRRGEQHLAELKYKSVKNVAQWRRELAPLAPLAMALRHTAEMFVVNVGARWDASNLLHHRDCRLAVVATAQKIAALASRYRTTHFDPELTPFRPVPEPEGVLPRPASGPPLFTPLDDEDVKAALRDDVETTEVDRLAGLLWQGWVAPPAGGAATIPMSYDPSLPSGRHSHLVVHAAGKLEWAAVLSVAFVGQDPTQPDDLNAAFFAFITEEMDLAYQFSALRHYAGADAALALLRSQILRSTLGMPILPVAVEDLARMLPAEHQVKRAKNERFLADAKATARLSGCAFDAIERYAGQIAGDPAAVTKHLSDEVLRTYGFGALCNQSDARLPFNPKQLEYAEIAGATLINLAVMDGFVGNNAAVAERLPRLARSSKAISTLKRAMLLQESHEVIGYDEGRAPKYGSPQLRTIHTAWDRAKYIAPLFAGLALEFHGKDMSPAAGRVANLKPVEVLAHRDPERIRRALSYALWFRDFGTLRIENKKQILAPELTVGIAIEGLQPQLPDRLPCIHPDILDQLIEEVDGRAARNHPEPGDGLYSDQDDVRLKLIRHRIYETTPTEDRLVWPFRLLGEER